MGGTFMKAVLLALAGFVAGVFVGIGIAPASRDGARAPHAPPTSHPDAADPVPRGAVDDALSPEVKALVARTRLPDLPAGTGRITGTVRDDDNEPVPDVTIAAEPIDHETRPRPRRDRGPGPYDLEAAVREAVEYELWHRKAERTATTDAAGRYVLEGLLDASYTVRAFGQGWLIFPRAPSSSTAPGGTFDFVARPVGTVDVKVLRPDGAPASGAMVWVEHDGGRGGGVWSPDHPHVDIPADGRTYTLWAEFGQGVAGLRSDGVPVVAARGATLPPIELRLRPRTSLTVRVEMPKGLRPDGVLIAARRLAEGERPDADLLRQERDQRTYGRDVPGVGTWFDVETGRFHVGAWWPGGRDLPLAVQDEVEVRGEPAEHVLRWPSPDPRVTRVVRVLDPGGAPLERDVSVERTSTGDERSHSATLPALRCDDGSLLVHLRPGEFDGEGEHRLAAEHPLYGRVSERFDPDGAAPVTLRFAAPIRVVVAVRGWGTTGVEGRLGVAVEAEPGSAAFRVLDAHGEARLGPLQPGTYELRLTLNEDFGSGFALGAERQALSSGTPRVELSVPSLHPLTIRCAAGTRVHVRPAERSSQSILVRSVPDDGVLRVDLPAGRYTVQSERSRVEVEVPGRADVTLE